MVVRNNRCYGDTGRVFYLIGNDIGYVPTRKLSDVENVLTT